MAGQLRYVEKLKGGSVLIIGGSSGKSLLFLTQEIQDDHH